MAYNTSSEYKHIIYSSDAKHKSYLSFNNVEFENVEDYLESAKITSRVIPNGNKGFYLDNFVSKELELVLHNIPNNIEIKDQVDFKIGTFVNNEYEDVPIGIFNIQDAPTTDKNKTTIKLRDNSVKFDFDYNAQPLIDENNGGATLLQILQDICLKAGANYVGSTTFLNYNKIIGVYDSTIKARAYVSYIAEQAGCIATIDRQGNLTFIPLNSLTTIQIPLNIVEKYDMRELYKITRVCYESGIIKYENPTSDDITNTNDTLYLDSANPFINTQEQIDAIKEVVNNFNFYSLKTGKIIGDPAIDSYDIIEIIDTENNNEVVGKTLATNVLTYNGVCRQTFDTTITKEAKQENVTKNSEETFKKWARSEIDNLDGKITLEVGQARSDIGEELTEKINILEEAMVRLTKENFEIMFSETGIQTAVDNLKKDLEENTVNDNNRSKYYTFGIDYFEIGETGKKAKLRITNDQIQFVIDGVVSAYIDGDKFVFPNGTITKRLQIGGHWVIYETENGNLNKQWKD